MLFYLLTSLFFIILPVVFWLWFFRSADVSDKEPKQMILRLFLIWGLMAVLLTFPVGFLGAYLDKFFPGLNEISKDSVETMQISAFAVAGVLFFVLIEEFAKSFILWIVVYHSPHFTQVIDGVVYGVSLALGFSFFENVGYLAEFAFLMHYEKTEFFLSGFLRSIYPTIMHLVTTGIFGLYLGRKKFSSSHSRSFVIKGLALAIFMHFVFNVSQLLFRGPLGMIISFCVILAGLVYLTREVLKPQNRVIWKLETK